MLALPEGFSEVYWHYYLIIISNVLIVINGSPKITVRFERDHRYWSINAFW